MLLGVPFGLAFGGGGEGLLWVRQQGEGTVLCGAQPLHQGLQLVLLLLEVQLHTASKKHREWGQTVARCRAQPSPLAELRRCVGGNASACVCVLSSGLLSSLNRICTRVLASRYLGHSLEGLCVGPLDSGSCHVTWGVTPPRLHVVGGHRERNVRHASWNPNS